MKLFLLLGLCGLLEACNYRFMKDGAVCDRENNCTYGCHNNRCWSECNGICCLTVDCINSDNLTCAPSCSIPEWCYLEGSHWDGYVKCRSNRECSKDLKENFPGEYKCGSTCTA